MKNKKLLIVGLGNPGEKYKDSPHNAGFLTIDRLLENYGLEIRADKKSQSELAESKNIVLAKPLTFMNSSGSAVKALVTCFMLHVSCLWLIHDDVDLELGKLKIVKNRGSAGHKGVEDIIQKLGTKNFIRFRVGIRPKHLPQKRSKSLMNKFIIGKFTRAQDKTFRESIIKCKEAVIFALENGIEKAMGVYNQK
jgi:PTH1 family peptidyl-tRNA hydrolase